MAAIASTAVRKVHEKCTGAAGIPYTVAAIAEREQVSLPPIEAGQIVTHSVAADLAERTAGVAYPAVYVFCEALHNPPCQPAVIIKQFENCCLRYHPDIRWLKCDHRHQIHTLSENTDLIEYLTRTEKMQRLFAPIR